MGTYIQGRGLCIRTGPDLSTIALDDAYEMAKSRHRKLLWRTSDPYRIRSVHPHTVNIEYGGISNTVSIACLTLSLTQAQGRDKLHGTKQITRPQHDNRQQWNAVKDSKKEIKGEAIVPQKNVVSRIMHYVYTTKKGRYVVRWYGYGPGDDTMELPRHIRWPVIRRYWNHLTRKKQRARRNYTTELLLEGKKIF